MAHKIHNIAKKRTELFTYNLIILMIFPDINNLVYGHLLNLNLCHMLIKNQQIIHKTD
jgi:hypothetical protein